MAKKRKKTTRESQKSAKLDFAGPTKAELLSAKNKFLSTTNKDLLKSKISGTLRNKVSGAQKRKDVSRELGTSSQTKAKKSFEKWNDDMYKKHANENRYNHPNFLIRYLSLKRVKSIVSLLDSKPTDSVLDLGCGCGYVMLKIKNYKSLLGVDLSDAALKEAAGFLRKKKNTWLLKGDVQAFKNKNNKKFDKIVCAEVIEHVPKPSKLIDTIARLSKKNTDIIITVPNEDAINFVFKIFKFLRIHKIFGGVTIKMDWHLHEFNLKKFKKLVKDRLDIVKVKRNPFWFFALSYVVKCRIK